jgi:hypothetical protein
VLSVSIIRREGVDLCEGQVLARCCIDDVCADIPLEASVQPGLYSLEEAQKRPNLNKCIDVLSKQRGVGIKRIEVCRSRDADRCARKLAEYVVAKYGGPVLLVGFNRPLTGVLFALSEGVVADVEGRLMPYEFIDISNSYQQLAQVRVVVVAPGALHYVDLAELVKKAKEMGKPVIMYGALSALYKDLGVEYFCPYGKHI